MTELIFAALGFTAGAALTDDAWGLREALTSADWTVAL